MDNIENQRKTKKKLLMIPAALAGLALLVLLAARLYFRLPVREYYAGAEKAFLIPGLDEGFVPQGLSYDAPSDSFFVTGYMGDGSASPVYVVSRDGALRGKTLLAAPDGSPFTGHAGGLSVYGDYVYVAGGADCCVYVYAREAFLSRTSAAQAPCLGTFDTRLPDGDGIGVAFTAVHDGKLYVGEFYREQNYPTPASHKRVTQAGDYNQALALCYEFSDGPDAAFGLAPAPAAAYSLPDLAQGMCFYDGKVWLSTSYAVAFSHIYAYDEARLGAEGEIAGVPLYALDSAALAGDFRFPPMSEEIEFVDGRLYTMCESASAKYIFGRLTGGRWCYAASPE